MNTEQIKSKVKNKILFKAKSTFFEHREEVIEVIQRPETSVEIMEQGDLENGVEFLTVRIYYNPNKLAVPE